jgi:uncharacterized membrane protein YdjX (TVP38/TMEM64 family)
MIGYMAGLTDIPLKKLLVLVTLGRLPSVIIMNYVGMGISQENLFPVAIVTGIAVFILAIFVWKREQIIKKLKGSKDNPESLD